VIITPHLMYVHIPKTGGMSLTKYFAETLAGPVYAVQPLTAAVPLNAIVVEGQRHETLQEGLEIAERLGVATSDIRLFLATVRNPYALEVSRYAYLRLGHEYDRGFNQNLALNYDLATFARLSDYHRPGHRIHDYLEAPQSVSKRVATVRIEDLDSLAATLAAYDVEFDPSRAIPRINQTKHGHWRDVLLENPDAEPYIFERYKELFDAGMYERLELSGGSIRDHGGWRVQVMKEASAPARLDVQPPTGREGPLRLAEVTWSTGSELAGEVTVEVGGEEAKLFARAKNGSRLVDWLEPASSPYIFTLQLSGGGGDVLATVAVSHMDFNRESPA
jgi:hypothetical protein